MRSTCILAFCTFLLVGCGTFVPVQNVSEVPDDELQAAYKIETYTVGSDKSGLDVAEYLGDITAYSCKHMMWDPPASKGNALTQLKLKALDMGAEGIIDVTFDSRGTDTFGTNCWESVQASGMAVKFNR